MPESESKRLEGRNGAIWREHSIHGRTQEYLAEKYGVSQQYISQVVAQVRATIGAPDRSALITESIELIREIQARALEIVDMAGAPVAVGKDGTVLIDPDTGAVVRDYSGRLKAMDTALKASDTLAKRLGLDAAQKIESTSTVSYTLVGVDPEALT
jgi:hypothetical protein